MAVTSASPRTRSSHDEDRKLRGAPCATLTAPTKAEVDAVMVTWTSIAVLEEPTTRERAHTSPQKAVSAGQPGVTT
jgi:hypothetical protein